MYTVIKPEVCTKYVISYNEYISDVYDMIYIWMAGLLQVMSLFKDKMHMWLAGLNDALS
jgi:hypothetical protein